MKIYDCNCNNIKQTRVVYNNYTTNAQDSKLAILFMEYKNERTQAPQPIGEVCSVGVMVAAMNVVRVPPLSMSTIVVGPDVADESHTGKR